MFRRKIEQTINQYFNSERNKILVIDGARQIGKTYIVRKLAKQRFTNYIEINLKEDYDGKKEFEHVRTTSDFYIQVSSLFGTLLNNREDTVIFLDEIQVYPHIISLLKPLNQEAKYTYIVTGSLLGVTLKHVFIPMGSIDEVRMYPMDFEEFLWANNVGEDAINYLKDCFNHLSPINESLHQLFLRRFKEYLISGGLPDAIKEFVTNKNVAKTREVHRQTYTFYSDDCSKYDEEHKLKIRRIYNLMPSYMENKVKRIQVKDIDNIQYGRNEKYLEEYEYLVSSGIALSVKAISNPKFPLIESSTKNLQKLYFNDVGLLSYILYHNNVRAILDYDSGVNLGTLYETAVAMELIAHGHELYYFDSKKIGEVDFLYNDYDHLSVIPIEVKSGNDQYSYRSIPKLVDNNGLYKLSYGYILGNKNIVKKDNNLITLPIYLIMFI